jgi:hypothetical protein
MLGLQSYCVNIPYEYEQSGTDLFDSGDKFLRPVVHGYHGLQYLHDGENLSAKFFITGKNFHPTLTHVVVGGSESHSLSKAEGNATVEVISRELLLVHTTNLDPNLSNGGPFEVRVGTPAGLSGPLRIEATPAAPSDPPPTPDFVWKIENSLVGYLRYNSGTGNQPAAEFYFDPSIKDLCIGLQINTPLLSQPSPARREVIFLITGLNGRDEVVFKDQPTGIVTLVNNALALESLKYEINALLNQPNMINGLNLPKKLVVDSHIRFDDWPFRPLGPAIEIQLDSKLLR